MRADAERVLRGMARLGQARQSWAGPAGVGGGRVVEELRTPHGRSKMTTNRLYGSMCGSRASEPSSRSRVGLHDTNTRRRLQGLGWVQPTMGGMHAVKQAKHCSESTCSFQVAVKGASTSSGTLRAALGRCGTVPFSLNLHIFPALPASTARLEGRGGQIRNRDSVVKCLKTALEIFFFSHVSSDNAPCITSDFFARPHLLGRRAPPPRSVNSWGAGGLKGHMGSHME